MSGILTGILGIVIFIGAIAITYMLCYNNIQALIIKINEAEALIDELLRKKYDMLNSIKEVIIDETKIAQKTFDEFDKVKDINISSFDFERKLTEFDNLVEKIKGDHPKLENSEKISNYSEDMYELNEKLEAGKSFYNKYTTELNTTIKKFPSNLIAFFHHIKVQAFFDGKDMFDEDIKDFKL